MAHLRGLVNAPQTVELFLGTRGFNVFGLFYKYKCDMDCGTNDNRVSNSSCDVI